MEEVYFHGCYLNVIFLGSEDGHYYVSLEKFRRHQNWKGDLTARRLLALNRSTF